MMYFWCESGEDGTSIAMLNEAQIAKRLEEVAAGDWGKVEFLSTIPRNDKGCWMGVPERAVVVIKGEIVTPKATQVVKAYTLEQG
jgi:hypothetical protein